MIDNSQDKGYTHVRVKDVQDGLQLCEMKIYEDSGEMNFYVDYENGSIYVDWRDGSPREIIGYYESTASAPHLAKVFDSTKSRVIGRVGEELIYFRAREADFSKGRYSPDEECLAYYTKNGNITALSALPYLGRIDGSEIGGAAAFVALFYTFKFKSVFRDYFELDNDTFKQIYARYLNPLGF